MMSMMGRALARMLTQKRRSISALAMFFVAVFGVSGLALPGAAAAQSVYGAQVRLDYAFPTSTEFFCNGPTVTAGVGVEFSEDCTGQVRLRVDVTPTTAVITFTAPFSFNGSVAQNGPRLTFTGASDMSGSTVAAGSAGIRGFTATANYVQVDFGGVVRAAGDVVTINLSGTFGPPVPTVTALSPTSGSAGGGTSVTLTGTNLTGATAVNFGATAASAFTVNSATSITAIAPPNAVGPVDVTVTTPAGTSDVSGAGNDFTYTGVSGIAPGSLSDATVGAAYSASLTATGCVGPCTFAVTAGALPAGITLSSAGEFSGTPTAGGPFNFTVTATDAGAGDLTVSQAYTLTVAAPTLALNPGSLTDGTAGVAYSQTVSASGGTAPYSYAVSSGLRPQGLTLSSTGELSGTPTQVGTFTFSIDATDSSTGVGAPYSTSTSYTVTIAAPTIVVAPGSLPNAQAAVAYNQTITASGGNGPYSYAVTAGALPAGVTLSSNGALSGSPTAGGTFNFTVTATDSTTGGTFTGSTAYSLVVDAPAIVLSSAALPNPTVAVSGYSQTITATGGNAPYTYAVTAGALPAGMSFSSAGVLSGTPTAGGTFNFTVTATDSTTGGTYTGSRAYSLTVNAPTIVVTPTTIPGATRGFAFSRTFSATGGVGTYSYSVSAGALPAGTTLTAAGVLSGTPTVTGTFNFTVRATDQSTGSGPYSGTVPVTLVVSGAVISVTPTSLPAVMAGLPYEQVMSATGGSGAYSYAVTAGALPSGIILIPSGSGAGRLVGSSYSPGTFNFTVTATDAFSNTGSVALSLTIQSRPDPSQDPDVRGINQAQAEAVRRQISTQIENFSVRLEDLRDGTAGSSQGIRLQSGIVELGQQADARTRFGGGRVFDQAVIDPDRAELNAMLWRGAEPTGTAGTAGVTNASMSGQPGVGQPVYGMGNSLGLAGAPASSGGLGGTAQGEQGADPAGGVRLWTGGSITIGDRDAETGQPSMSVTSSGLSVGADIALSPTFDLGFGGGLGEENTDVGSRDSRVESKTFVGVVYGSWRPQDGVYIDGMVGYGSLSFDMDRRVAIDSSLVTGSRDGKVVFGSLGLGFDRLVGTGRLSTYGRLESLNAELDAYTEVGSPFWALSYAERDVESLQGVIGTRYVWSRINRDSVWTPSVRAEYRQELAEGGLQSLRYADWAGGPVYQIDQSSWDRGELNLGFGLNVQTTSGWAATGELGARLSEGQSLGTVRLGLSRKF
jgi:hypothetical protein